MKTKQDQEELGTQIIVEAVSLYPKTWRYCRKALHLRSKSLFNIPAIFLKSDTVEYRHIIDEFQRVALRTQISIYFS
jgi:DNA mismatch repair protein MutL